MNDLDVTDDGERAEGNADHHEATVQPVDNEGAGNERGGRDPKEGPRAELSHSLALRAIRATAISTTGEINVRNVQNACMTLHPDGLLG